MVDEGGWIADTIRAGQHSRRDINDHGETNGRWHTDVHAGSRDDLRYVVGWLCEGSFILGGWEHVLDKTLGSWWMVSLVSLCFCTGQWNMELCIS